MFIRDALCNSNSYEPWWFTLMRRSSALIFVCLVVTYGIVQFEYLETFRSSPNILIIEPKFNASRLNFPGFMICPGFVSPNFINDTAVPNQPEPQFSVTCGRSSAIGPETLSDNMNIIDENCAKELFQIENGCFKLKAINIDDNSNMDDNYYGSDNPGDNKEIDSMITQGFNRTFMFFNIKPNNNEFIQPPFYTIYFVEYSHRDSVNSMNYALYSIDNDNQSIEYNMFPINTAQRTILEYSITVHRAFSNPIMGQLNTQPDNSSIEIKADTRMIQEIPNNQQETQFVLMPKIPHYVREEIEKYEYHPISAISNLGGFYGAIVAFYMACFGMPKIEPWGILQRTILRCWSSRRSFKRRLAEHYVSGGGIPLGEEVEDRPEGSTLEERIRVLESVLKEHYLDTYYLDNLCTTKSRYEVHEQKHNDLECLLNEPMEISVIPSPTFPTPTFPSPTFPSPTYPSAYPNYGEEVGTSSSSSSPPVCVRINYPI